MDDSKARAYLLGQLPASEAERLEEQALQKDDVFQTLRSVEDDLFDEYARNTLSAADRERFLERYGDQKDRLAFAHTLAARPAAQRLNGVRPAGGRVIPFPARRWVATLAAAAVVVLAVSAIVVRREHAPVTALAPGISDAPAVVRGVVARAEIALGTSRAPGAPPVAGLPTNATALELRVRLDPADRYDRYVMELRSSANNVVWGGDDLQASTEAGELIVRATVPAAALSPGIYDLAVRGGFANAQLEDLGFVSLEVRRTP